MKTVLNSLKEGTWFKLICGASYQHLPAVRNLTLAYTLAGADCIDVAADPAVIVAAKSAIKVATSLGKTAQAKGFLYQNPPILMVSLNDGEDPHFRKAFFESTRCPVDCPRPCEQICPAGAISFSGVLAQQCYGCGRCLPICPHQLIEARSYVSTPGAIAPILYDMGIAAIEIHTQVGRNTDFHRLWQAIAPYQAQLQILAISCPDGENLREYLHSLAQIVKSFPGALIWQSDGRPMSGDIGLGTTHAAIKLAKKVLKAGLPGSVQLAGGTNNYTVTKLIEQNLLKTGDRSSHPYVAGVAYGSYARSLLLPILDELEALNPSLPHLEDYPSLLWQAVDLAHNLVSQIKQLEV
ncbi:circadian clock protein LdpA [Gloeocapsa sp. PCC 73106]|uniref:circadian clock protein LdpA n=1 Tax=Gloeocapsa sp. PCC 73106 TaxID=102232 RepID=UPI0002ABFBB2|nr:LdpA C-terminal domain-containing domain [Gloeocapsa sp. PCC 73106]ELR98094.1 Fe-S-cluster-containing hydrogenase subunit [Gloeocapsa sp. PCC 73106]